MPKPPYAEAQWYEVHYRSPREPVREFRIDRRRRTKATCERIVAEMRASGNYLEVWLGVSVENQAAADARIPELLKTPAAVRFLSCEPLIGPVTLDGGAVTARGTSASWLRSCDACTTLVPDHCPPERVGIDWVIAGCESGPGARPCSVEWLRSLRDQCAAARVPFFCKQAEDANARTSIPGTRHIRPLPTTPAAINRDAVTCGDGSKRKAGGVIELPYLDGVQHAAFPEVSL